MARLFCLFFKSGSSPEDAGAVAALGAQPQSHRFFSSHSNPQDHSLVQSWPEALQSREGPLFSLEVLASTYLHQHTTGLSLQVQEVEWVCFLIPALQVSKEVRKIE